MGTILGIIIDTEMGNGGISGMQTAMRASMECWNVGVPGAATD